PARHVQTAGLPGDPLQLLVEIDRVLLQSGDVRIAIESVHAAGGVPGGSTGELAALDQQHIFPAGLRQVIQDARADHPAADHYYPRVTLHRLNLTRWIRPAARAGARRWHASRSARSATSGTAQWPNRRAPRAVSSGSTRSRHRVPPRKASPGFRGRALLRTGWGLRVRRPDRSTRTARQAPRCRPPARARRRRSPRSPARTAATESGAVGR